MEPIKVNPERISFGSINPREDLGDLSEIINSIKERQALGLREIILPLLVRKLEGNEAFDWEVIDGKRRLQSALATRLTKVPIVEETDTDSVRELVIMSYLANDKRKDFNWVERAKVFRRLNKEFEMTYEDIGKHFHLSKQRVSTYVNLLNKLEDKEKVPLAVLDMETLVEIVNKCPDEDIPELIQYAIENDIPRDEIRKILFALRNYYASQEVVKDFHKDLHKDMHERYHHHRFEPKFMALYEKEKVLKMGETGLIDYYLDISDYPTRESATEYAKEFSGEVIGPIHRDGWHLRIKPYNMTQIQEKYDKLSED